jgi:RNA recognition motif-containing protein
VHLPDPPEDLNISTLFLGGIKEEVDEDDIKEAMKHFGKIKAIKIIFK